MHDRRHIGTARTEGPRDREWPVVRTAGSARSRTAASQASASKPWLYVRRSSSASPVDDRPSATRVRQEERHINARQPLQVFSTVCRAQYEKGIVEGVAGRTAAREHRDAQDALNRSASTWIHDVG